MNVLSLFDGMSCGQIALERAGIKVDNYFASEIDPYAIKVTQKNYPNTNQLGDVTKWYEWDLPKIDLLIGGSPCQGFSVSGKGLNFNDPRSKLFFEFADVRNAVNPTNFLLENVKMKKEWEQIITNSMYANPIEINSSLVSAQNRVRLYWTDIPNVTQPEDKGIYFGDIREHDADSRYYYSEKALEWIRRHSERTGKQLRVWDDNTKVQMLEASMFKNYSAQRFFGIPDTKGLRYITPLECERAQTVPEGYTDVVSNTQRYKMLGNGWTVDVLTHIFKRLKTVS